MLYFIENAENYSKNRRGEILMARDSNFPSNWVTLSQANFGGDEELDLSSLSGEKIDDLEPEQKEIVLKYLSPNAKVSFKKAASSPFEKLSPSERKLRLASKGLDKLNREELTYIQTNPEAFVWPESINGEVQSAVITRLLEYEGKDLWDTARVGAVSYTLLTLPTNREV